VHEVGLTTDALTIACEPARRSPAWREASVIRLSTSPHVFDRPLSPVRAFDIIDRWLGQPCAVIIHPGDRHGAVVRHLLQPFGTAGNVVNDAHLAAVAIEHGAELHSCDSDFSRFSGLRWVNPLDAR
jgi:uncharacterized protein